MYVYLYLQMPYTMPSNMSLLCSDNCEARLLYSTLYCYLDTSDLCIIEIMHECSGKEIERVRGRGSVCVCVCV